MGKIMIWDPSSDDENIRFKENVENLVGKQQEEYKRMLKESENHDEFRPVLLMASYCNNPECTDSYPCEDCLHMCNIVFIPTKAIIAKNILCGYDFLKIKI